ncbi:MAG: hypothetical protein WD696_18150 [Bryobacteraceae bacterium]
MEDAMARCARTLELLVSGESLFVHSSDLKTPEHIVVRRWSSDETAEVSSRIFLTDGSETLSEPTKVPIRTIMSSVLGNDLRSFSQAVRRLFYLFSGATFILESTEHESKELRVLEMYDPELVRTLRYAWEADGGFVEAFSTRLGLEHLFDEQLVRMTDATFNANNPVHGYAVSGQVKDFDITSEVSVGELVSLIKSHQASISSARTALKAHLIQHYKIEEIL